MEVIFFKNKKGTVFATQSNSTLSSEQIAKLNWLLEAEKVPQLGIQGELIGPRIGLITPWSTSAVEIAAKAGISVLRIEEFIHFGAENTTYT
jgi:phosphoribosylformylglycinamidine synthase